MITFDTTARSLTVGISATTAASSVPVIASYADIRSTSFALAASRGRLTGAGTRITAVPAPPASAQYQLKSLIVTNVDTMTHSVSAIYNDNVSADSVFVASLAPGERLQYSGETFQVYDTSGAIKTASPSSVVLLPKPIYGGGGLSSEYPAGFGGTTLGNVVPTQNVFRAFPFITPPRNSQLSQISFNIITAATAATASARVGVYAITSPTNLYPGSLVVDGGEYIVNTTGVKAASITTNLLPNTVYWAAHLVGGATATARGYTAYTDVFQLLGIPTGIGTGTPYFGLTATQTYGALPATFPGGGALINTISNNWPIIALRWGA